MQGVNLNVTIVGLGLIGGSFAKALREIKVKNIWAVDLDREVLNIAEEEGVIDKGYQDAEVPIKDSDLVIICLYPNQTIKFVKQYMNLFKKGAIITDVAGVKSKIVEEVHLIIRKDIDFIGGHPMAGKETKGFKFASKDIFVGANYILTPTSKNKIENIEFLEDIIKKMGFKHIERMTPKQHDLCIALISQLPHVIASALMNTSKDQNLNGLVGNSFKDATRVAKINTDLWIELLMENKSCIIEKIEDFEESLVCFKKYILNDDVEGLSNYLNMASIKREEII